MVCRLLVGRFRSVSKANVNPLNLQLDVSLWHPWGETRLERL